MQISTGKITGGPLTMSEFHAAPSEHVFTATIKVKEDNYLPPGVEKKMQLSKKMLTGMASKHTLTLIQQDPRVEVITIAERIRQNG